MSTNDHSDVEHFIRLMGTCQGLAYGSATSLIVISCLAIFHGHTWVGLVGLASALTAVGIVLLVVGTAELVVRTVSALGHVSAITKAIAGHVGFDVEEPAELDVT